VAVYAVAGLRDKRHLAKLGWRLESIRDDARFKARPPPLQPKVVRETGFPCWAVSSNAVNFLENRRTILGKLRPNPAVKMKRF